ncbi:MAG: TonB-dependent receptor [Deltaproteobacteria bacterium]|nr:TonB-dependent receptor [Deltaproteobacteria bacterium]
MSAIKLFQVFSLLFVCISSPFRVFAQSPAKAPVAAENVSLQPTAVSIPNTLPSVVTTPVFDPFRTSFAEIADSARHLPGVYIQHSLPQAGTLSLRGHTGGRNIIKIDGVRFSNGLFGTSPNHYLSAISPSLMHRLTLRRGPGAFFFANGIGGSVIDISSEAPPSIKTGPGGEGAFYFSSGTHTPGIFAKATMQHRNHSVALGANYLSMGDIRAGNGDKLPFSSFEDAGWMARIVLQPEQSPVAVTGAYLGHLANDRSRTDQLGFGTLQSYHNQDNLLYVKVAWKPGDMLKRLNIVASYHQMVEKKRRLNCAITGGKERISISDCRALRSAHSAIKSSDTVDTFGLDASSRFAMYQDRFFLFGNIEYYFDNIISAMEAAQNFSTKPYYMPQNRGLYSSGTWFSRFGTAIGTDVKLIHTEYWDLWMQLGGRFSHFATYAPIVPGIDADMHQTHSGFTDTAELMLQFRDFLSIWGAYATGMRAPNLQESSALGYIDNQYRTPATELNAELSNQYDTGIQLSLKPIRLGTAFFYNRIDQFIDEKPNYWQSDVQRNDGTLNVTSYNARKAIIKGVENTLEIFIGDITLFGTLTWQKGTVYDNTENYMAELTGYAQQFPMRRLPHLFGSAGIQYNHPDNRFFTAMHLDWSDTQHRLHPLDTLDSAICEDGEHSGKLQQSCNSFSGYYTLGIQSGIQLNRFADVSISLRNMLDRNYKTLGSSQRAPGFDAQTIIRFHF